MIQGFIDGIKNTIGNIGKSIGNIADTVKSYLHFSRPDRGPLREYEKWMPDMIKGLSKTLHNSAPRLYEESKKLAQNVADNLDLTNAYEKMRSAVDFETQKLSANLSATATSNKILTANINLQSPDIIMDSTKVGRAVTPTVSKTIRSGGIY